MCLCLVKAKYQRNCLKKHKTVDETKVRRLMTMGVDMTASLDEATVLPPRSCKRPKRSADEASLPSSLGGKKKRIITNYQKKPTFEENLEALKEYKGNFGTCNVQEHNCHGQFRGLFTFVHYWLSKIKYLERDPGRKSQKDETKIERLTEVMGEDEIGYSIARAKWERNLSLLAEYKELYGTCAVSTTLDQSSKFRGLHSWVAYQQRHIHDYDKHPATSSLDENQYKRLMELGLDKAPKMQPLVLKSNGQWEEMFEEMERFVKEMGHAYVPYKPRSRLRNWVELMREHYVKMKEGKNTTLTPERIHRLLQLGFSFHPKNERFGFDDRALQWLEYKTKHGHDPPTGTLGTWVRYAYFFENRYNYLLSSNIYYCSLIMLHVFRSVRQKLELRNEGEKTNLTQERFDKLTAWGFKVRKCHMLFCAPI
jgi:hypothetical protein